MRTKDELENGSSAAHRSELECWNGPTYQDIISHDAHAAPDFLRRKHTKDLDVPWVSASRYTSQEFFDLEVEKVWFRTWQFACHETEIPNHGDTVVFELLGRSVIIVRQADGGIRAFRNICLHRGRQLVQDGGCKRHFRCPYHGFTWGLDGALEKIPAAWDFPQIPDEFPLLHVLTESWAGFVFVNFDDGAAPLSETLGPIPEHFSHWNIERCYKAAHVGKVVPANWKVVAEAFLEAHHVASTHPQMIAYSNDANYQCDVLTDHVTRMMGAAGTPGVLADNIPEDQADVVKAMFGGGSRAGTVQSIPYEPGLTARRYAAETSRRALQETVGGDFSQQSEADLLDPISYDVFPNFHIWGGLALKIGYRFRPHGSSPNEALMEMFLFKLAPETGVPPKPAPFTMLSAEQSWADAPELGYLGAIIAQDDANLGFVQKGLRDLGDKPIALARYSEVRIRNLHRTIDAYIARP